MFIFFITSTPIWADVIASACIYWMRINNHVLNSGDWVVTYISLDNISIVFAKKRIRVTNRWVLHFWATTFSLKWGRKSERIRYWRLYQFAQNITGYFIGFWISSRLLPWRPMLKAAEVNNEALIKKCRHRSIFIFSRLFFKCCSSTVIPKNDEIEPANLFKFREL